MFFYRGDGDLGWIWWFFTMVFQVLRMLGWNPPQELVPGWPCDKKIGSQVVMLIFVWSWKWMSPEFKVPPRLPPMPRPPPQWMIVVKKKSITKVLFPWWCWKFLLFGFLTVFPPGWLMRFCLTSTCVFFKEVFFRTWNPRDAGQSLVTVEIWLSPLKSS